jgi:5-methylcytosine-specific restriction endonuclease McrA
MGPNQRACPQCGKPRHRQSALCRECYLAAHRSPESYADRVCPVCAKAFVVHRTHIERGQGIYCSSSCARSGSPTHPRNGSWRSRKGAGYKRWRLAVIERDHGFCRLCHATDDLQVHHIKTFADHPDHRGRIDNGVTLCAPCHRRFRGVEHEHEELLSFVASVPVVVWSC